MYSVLLPWTAAKVLSPMDGAFKTYTSLHHNLTQADLDFLIFVQRNKTDSLCANCQSKNRKPPFDTLIYKKSAFESLLAGGLLVIFKAFQILLHVITLHHSTHDTAAGCPGVSHFHDILCTDPADGIDRYGNRFTDFF